MAGQKIQNIDPNLFNPIPTPTLKMFNPTYYTFCEHETMQTRSDSEQSENPHELAMEEKLILRRTKHERCTRN